jgi:hypothetical protein
MTELNSQIHWSKLHPTTQIRGDDDEETKELQAALDVHPRSPCEFVGMWDEHLGHLRSKCRGMGRSPIVKG